MANNSYYRKEDYIERCRTQREAYQLLLRGIKMLKSELPIEDEKRFNSKDLEVLNKFFAGEHLFFYFSDQWETRYLYINIQDVRYNNVCHTVQLGWEGVFKGGKINGLVKLNEQIANTINRYEGYVERYEKAVDESQIRLFQSRYAAFHKAYKELKAMDMPEIYIEYLSDICPIKG